MRHLVFSRLGLDQTANIVAFTRSAASHTNPNVLASVQFQRDFGSHETLFANASRNMVVTNVASVGSSEPESVCYCTGAPQSYLYLSN